MPVADRGRIVVWASRRGTHLGQRSCASAREGRTYERKRSDHGIRQRHLASRGPSTYGICCATAARPCVPSSSIIIATCAKPPERRRCPWRRRHQRIAWFWNRPPCSNRSRGCGRRNGGHGPRRPAFPKQPGCASKVSLYVRSLLRSASNARRCGAGCGPATPRRGAMPTAAAASSTRTGLGWRSVGRLAAATPPRYGAISRGAAFPGSIPPSGRGAPGSTAGPCRRASGRVPDIEAGQGA